MKAGEVRRAKVILRLAAGQSYRTISKQEGCGQDFVARWKERFATERLAGFYARHRGKIVSENIIRQEAKILNATSKRLLPVRLIGVPGNWLGIWAFRTVE
jgi:transposase